MPHYKHLVIAGRRVQKGAFCESPHLKNRPDRSGSNSPMGYRPIPVRATDVLGDVQTTSGGGHCADCRPTIGIARAGFSHQRSVQKHTVKVEVVHAPVYVSNLGLKIQECVRFLRVSCRAGIKTGTRTFSFLNCFFCFWF